MKKLLHSKKVHLLFAAAALAVASCYTIKSIEMPHEVAPGGEFTVRATIISNEGAKTSNGDYGIFGIRVPEDWEVEIPTNVLEYYDADGNLVTTYSGVPNEVVTNVLNYRYPADGYKWLGYSTGLDGDPKLSLGFAGENDTDYYVVNCKVTAGMTEGDYELEFVFGDEEDGFAKYAANMDHDPNTDPRLFETGTFVPDPTKENGVKTNGDPAPSVRNSVDIDTSIKVTDAAGVEAISADEFAIEGGTNGIRVIATGAGAASAVVTVYDVEGHKLDCRSIIGGEANLKAVKGLNLVEVLKGGNKAVKKIWVK